MIPYPSPNLVICLGKSQDDDGAQRMPNQSEKKIPKHQNASFSVADGHEDVGESSSVAVIMNS